MPVTVTRVAVILRKHGYPPDWRMLDDKIELNQRTNHTLEAMARALFKSWFVDFDPVRANVPRWRDATLGLPQPLADLFPDRLADSELGEIPEGWEAGCIGARMQRDFLDGALAECRFEHLDRLYQCLVPVEIAGTFSGTTRQLCTALRVRQEVRDSFLETSGLVDGCQEAVDAVNDDLRHATDGVRHRDQAFCHGFKQDMRERLCSDGRMKRSQAR